MKNVCLKHCRSPLSFFLTAWQDGPAGSFRMGFRHGLYCVGCCWALMALSFVVGVMNLLWMAAITLFIALDHTLLRGVWVGRVAGAAFILWGGWLLGR